MARLEANYRATARPTTTTTTTTTRAPSACEIERDSLIVSNPQDRHVPVCMVEDGAYMPDQYESSGISYCVDAEGEKIQVCFKISRKTTWLEFFLQFQDTIRNAPWIQNGARFDECRQWALRQ